MLDIHQASQLFDWKASKENTPEALNSRTIYIYIYKFVNCACIWLEICGFCACNAWFYDSLEGNICICLDWRHIYCDSNSWNAFDCPITVEQIISDIIEYLLFIVKSELNTFDNDKIVKSISDLINWILSDSTNELGILQ